MNQPEFKGQNAGEEPLDPATLRVQTKLKRLLAGSSLVMFAGFIAVFAAIFYKINSSDNSPSADTIASTISLGGSVEVQQVSLEDGRLVLLVEEAGVQSIVYADPSSGSILGRTRFLNR
ncbi:hypothetical protein [Roseibium sp.]|uniref:hypothetical protein n=1 Tax=Roseibium sp. TaxID=1936156 RepID=UPI003A97F38B